MFTDFEESTLLHMSCGTDEYKFVELKNKIILKEDEK